MPHTNMHIHIGLTQIDLDILYALSLKGYRLLTCRHLSMLYFDTEAACSKRMSKLSQAGLVTRLFIPTTDGEKRDVIYTLARTGAHVLAKYKDISPLGLATSLKPSFLFLEHGLRISDFMCSLESALRHSNFRLVSWRSERQLKPQRIKAFRVPHPFEPGARIPIIPDGLFSLDIDGRIEHFALEADRGTMSQYAMKKKMLGYIQLYRKGLHRTHFGVPHFRVLLVTNTLYRRDKLRQILKDIRYCPNLIWFTIWRDVSPGKILDRIWLKCRDDTGHSLIG